MSGGWCRPAIRSSRNPHPLAGAPDAGAAGRARSPVILVTDIEGRLGTRYTIDTVHGAASAASRRFTFIWLMGSDNLEQFSRWRRWQQIAAAHSHCGGAPAGLGAGASLHAPLARRFGVARRLGSAPSLVVLDGPRSQ